MASIQAKTAKSGKKTFYVVVSLKGKHRWIKAGTRKDANILRREIEALEESKRLEKLGFSGRDKRIDVFFQEYADHVRLRTSPNTVKRYLAVLNSFVTFLGMFHPRLRLISQVKPEHIESYQKQRLESVELKAAADGEKNGNHKTKRLPLPQTVNYEVSVLRSAFMWAHERELISVVPTKRIKKLRIHSKKEARILTIKEAKLFLREARDLAKKETNLRVFASVFKFMLNTGLRSGEICNLLWDDIDLDSGLIKIRPKPGWTPKGSAREFYLNETGMKVLGTLKQDTSFVFQTHSGKQLDSDTLRKVLIKVAKLADLSGLTRVHDLRHTFNSHMQMQGVDAATMATILGHRDISTTMIYTHQTAEHLRKCVNKIRLD